MPFIDHIRRANNADIRDFRPLVWQDRRIGWVRHDRVDALARWDTVFRPTEDTLVFAPTDDTYEGRTRALADVLESLAADGAITGWRDETYPLTQRFSDPPIAALERAACPYLGVPSWGGHLNGYVHKRDGLYLWIARRADDKPTYPGMLDNTVAGGMPLGLSPVENIVKECWEEAGIPETLAKRVQPVGAIQYLVQSDTGLKPDQMFCFDLELPADFMPENTDGEVADFDLMPAAEVLSLVRDTGVFKYNSNLCLIDFFIRHGLLTPDNEPDYLDLCAGLRGATIPTGE